MCGRYVLSMRPSQVRSHLIEQNMPVEEAPSDEDERVRQSYNFAPGYHGLIYRAHTNDRRSGYDRNGGDGGNDSGEPSPKKAKLVSPTVDGLATQETKYQLMAARWGLIPFWTKRPPDYGSQMRTINCRDDSLIEDRGMWNTMKKRKRCIVVAEGFYEWLKKNNGKEKIPHFTRRQDGQLMCFAGLWDMVQYEGSDEKLYTYTIITTDSNQQLKFLHDRMPVILEPGSEAMKAWLDPNHVGWSKELQSMLKPYQGELECYQVDKAVGKVGNNSPSFIVPIDSKENKKNIANFFGTQRPTAKEVAAKNEAARRDDEFDHVKIEQHPDEDRKTTVKVESTEDNAPLPRPDDESEQDLSQQIKKDAVEFDDQDIIKSADEQVETREISEVDEAQLLEAVQSPPTKVAKTEKATPSPVKGQLEKKASSQKKRSATSNNNVAKTPVKGNAKITSFFGK